MFAPCTLIVDAAADICRPTGATLTPVAPNERPVIEYETRHGANDTAVAPRDTPVMAREMRAAPLANLEGGETSWVPVT